MSERVPLAESTAISIHALLAESDTHPVTVFICVIISIHALLAESDFPALHNILKLFAISIHALLAESDAPQPPRGKSSIKFLSTLSLRRATLNSSWISSIRKNFYPRSPCGERPSGYQRPCGHPTKDFYPRSPCGERRFSYFYIIKITDFYPRSPCGERLPKQPKHQ